MLFVFNPFVCLHCSHRVVRITPRDEAQVRLVEKILSKQVSSPISYGSIKDDFYRFFYILDIYFFNIYIYSSVLFFIDFFIFTNIEGNLILNSTSYKTVGRRVCFVLNTPTFANNLVFIWIFSYSHLSRA